jgi:hypothetical protein
MYVPVADLEDIYFRAGQLYVGKCCPRNIKLIISDRGTQDLVKSITIKSFKNYISMKTYLFVDGGSTGGGVVGKLGVEEQQAEIEK